MTDIMTHAQIIQIFVSGGAGLLGVGIGIGMFKSTIKQVKDDVQVIRRRQARLRGEDNGGIPIFVTRDVCRDRRDDCSSTSNGKMQSVCDDLIKHTKSIKALDNFARWWMQKEGLAISEINKILEEK